MFNCDKCGSCCRNLDLNSLYDYLNMGNGICKYLDLESNLCKIYDSRPDICNVEKMYKEFFYNEYSEEEYIQINKKYCKELRGK